MQGATLEKQESGSHPGRQNLTRAKLGRASASLATEGLGEGTGGQLTASHRPLQDQEQATRKGALTSWPSPSMWAALAPPTASLTANIVVE